MKPPPPWLVISVVLWAAAFITIFALSSPSEWLTWPERVLGWGIGYGIGRYLIAQYKARRKGRSS